MTDYRKPVPGDRTIVPGFWSDLLDEFKASFNIDGDEVSLKTSISSLGPLETLLLIEMTKLTSINGAIVTQLKLMNARLESALDTSINEHDLTNDDSEL
tara:strand:- start:138 stop:434 length:297 start_codon:yes stop_codon:yes gene_type:complete